MTELSLLFFFCSFLNCPYKWPFIYLILFMQLCSAVIKNVYFLTVCIHIHSIQLCALLFRKGV